MKQYKVVRTYDFGTDWGNNLQKAFDDGYEFVRASEYVPEYGYIEYILAKEESEDGVKTELANVLDKIRAEIEQNAYPIVYGVNNHEQGMTLYGILQVIDKYKAESEDEE